MRRDELLLSQFARIRARPSGILTIDDASPLPLTKGPIQQVGEAAVDLQVDG